MVTSGGTPKLQLNTVPSESATYVSGSGTSTLAFDYTVQAGDTAGSLDTNALAPSGGTIRDAATNDAVTTLPNGHSLTDNKNIVVDTTAPNAPTVTAPVSGSTTGLGVTPSVSGEPGATLACALDGSPGSCSSFGSLTGGSHTFTATATDAAGNTSSATSVTWTVDTTPPDTLITANPANPSASTSAIFALGSNKPGATAECSLDGAAFSACPVTQTYNGLSAGRTPSRRARPTSTATPTRRR